MTIGKIFILVHDEHLYVYQSHRSGGKFLQLEIPKPELRAVFLFFWRGGGDSLTKHTIFSGGSSAEVTLICPSGQWMPMTA